MYAAKREPRGDSRGDTAGSRPSRPVTPGKVSDVIAEGEEEYWSEDGDQDKNTPSFQQPAARVIGEVQIRGGPLNSADVVETDGRVVHLDVCCLLGLPRFRLRTSIGNGRMLVKPSPFLKV